MLDHNHSQRTVLSCCTVLAGLSLLLLLLAGCGANTPKVYHVGILSGLDFFGNTVDGFKAGMTALGYIEGKNIVYDLQKTNEEPDKEVAILKKFVDDKVDLIFVFPTEESQEAKTATQGTNIPVLFAQANIEGIGLVNSVREPGGNITGVRFPGPDLAVKRFEILHQLVPQAKRMWIPYLKGYLNVAPQLDAVRPEAAAAGVTLVEAPVTTLADIQMALQPHEQANDIDAILNIAEPIAVEPDAFAVYAKFAAEHKIPVGGSPMVVGDYAAIFGVATDNVAVGKQAAPMADKILKGTQAGTIPVASAESFLQINYKAAQSLGLAVPNGLLEMANQIIR